MHICHPANLTVDNVGYLCNRQTYKSAFFHKKFWQAYIFRKSALQEFFYLAKKGHYKKQPIAVSDLKIVMSEQRRKLIWM